MDSVSKVTSRASRAWAVLGDRNFNCFCKNADIFPEVCVYNISLPPSLFCELAEVLQQARRCIHNLKQLLDKRRPSKKHFSQRVGTRNGRITYQARNPRPEKNRGQRRVRRLWKKRCVPRFSLLWKWRVTLCGRKIRRLDLEL